MTLFESVAQNYGIADREFRVKLSGAEVLSLISLVQIARATGDPEKFNEYYREAIEVVNGIIEVVTEVDQASGDQLRSGWGLGRKF